MVEEKVSTVTIHNYWFSKLKLTLSKSLHAEICGCRSFVSRGRLHLHINILQCVHGKPVTCDVFHWNKWQLYDMTTVPSLPGSPTVHQKHITNKLLHQYHCSVDTEKNHTGELLWKTHSVCLAWGERCCRTVSSNTNTHTHNDSFIHLRIARELAVIFWLD